MKALTIKQPWAHAILHLGKDIENRDWQTNLRGTIAVHASKKLDLAEAESFMLALSDKISRDKLEYIAEMWNNGKIIGGHIVGTVEVIDCVKKSDSPWFFGDYGFVLRNPRPLALPIPFRGALGVWEVPTEIEAKIREQLER